MENQMEQQINFAQAQTCLLMEPQHSNILGHVHGGRTHENDG